RTKHPDLYLVGDYLFDSTINGAFDSADFVTDMILTRLRKKKYGIVPSQPSAKELVKLVKSNGHNGHVNGHNGHVNGSNGASRMNGSSKKTTDVVAQHYHDLYDGERPYEESWREYFCEHYTTDLIR